MFGVPVPAVNQADFNHPRSALKMPWLTPGGRAASHSGGSRKARLKFEAPARWREAGGSRGGLEPLTSCVPFSRK